MVSNTYIEQEKRIPSFNEYFEGRAPPQYPYPKKGFNIALKNLLTNFWDTMSMIFS